MFNIRFIKGDRSLSINYEGDSYLFSTLEYEGYQLDVIIDTGAQKSILKKDVLDIVHHKINKRITVKLIDFFGNITKAQIAKVKSIQFGECELKNFSFIFSDNFHSDLGSIHLQGIIGIDILEYFDLHFIANKYALKLVKPKRTKENPEIWIDKELINVDGSWGFNISIGGKQIFAVIDTGLPGYLSIPTSFQNDFDWVKPIDEKLSSFDLWTDNNDAFIPIIIKEVEVFNKELTDVPAVINSGIDSFLVGLELLNEFDIIISFQRKKIYIKK